MTLLFWVHAMLLAALSLFGLHRLLLLWRLRLKPRALPAPEEEAWCPAITVQLPLFNERHVAERVIRAAAALDWPELQIQVLDDSTDDTTELAQAVVEDLAAQGVDIVLAHRAHREGFKAGALEEGMAWASGELIAVFDADFVPQAGILRALVPSLRDPGVGMVQARWGHANLEESWLTRAQGVLLDGHFVIEHEARFRSGCWFNFNGTAGVWRKACIQDAGGWQHDTLTEDLDLSYRAQARGWRFVYRAEQAVPAELPHTLQAFQSQQHRWAKGSIQCARKLLGSILRAQLPIRVKLEACLHLLANLAYPLVLCLALVSPLAPFRSGAQAELVQGMDALALFATTVSVWCFYGVAVRRAGDHAGWGRIPVAMALGVGMSVAQTRAVIEAIVGHKSPFVRTPKRGSDQGSYRAFVRLPWAELLLCGWQLCGVLWALQAGFWGAVPLQLFLALGFGVVGIGGVLGSRRS